MILLLPFQGVASSCNDVKKVAEAGDLCYPLFNKPNSWEHHNHYGVTYIPPLSLLEEEELIWLFSSVILLLLFLRKLDELVY